MYRFRSVSLYPVQLRFQIGSGRTEPQERRETAVFVARYDPGMLGCLGSVVTGFFLMIPLAMVFNAMDWPLFHSWGLAHGSFIIAWPMLTVLSFAVFHGSRWLGKRQVS